MVLYDMHRTSLYSVFEFSTWIMLLFIKFIYIVQCTLYTIYFIQYTVKTIHYIAYSVQIALTLHNTNAAIPCVLWIIVVLSIVHYCIVLEFWVWCIIIIVSIVFYNFDKKYLIFSSKFFSLPSVFHSNPSRSEQCSVPYLKCSDRKGHWSTYNL